MACFALRSILTDGQDHCVLGRVCHVRLERRSKPIEQGADGTWLIRYLEHEFMTSYKYSNIVLLRPSMAMMLMQTPDPRTIKVWPLACAAVESHSATFRTLFLISQIRPTSFSLLTTQTIQKLLKVGAIGHFCSYLWSTVLRFTTTHCRQEI